MFILANKNDLRFIKTEKLIADTYISLKMKSSNPVKVSELCRAALINKTTFYTHYETIENLHRQVCRKTVSDILKKADFADKAFSDTYTFICAITQALSMDQKLLKALYGDDVQSLLNDAEETLLEMYLREDDDPERRKRMIFCVGGTSRLLLLNRDGDSIHAATELIQKVFDLEK